MITPEKDHLLLTEFCHHHAPLPCECGGTDQCLPCRSSLLLLAEAEKAGRALRERLMENLSRRLREADALVESDQ